VPLVDINALLDLVTNDQIWADRSARQLRIPSKQGSELSVGYDRVEDVDAALDAAGIELVEIPRAALFLAGKAFRSYRPGRHQDRRAPRFPHRGACRGRSLVPLTRDVRHYRSYFPMITLITPGDA
jgi:hypothetical protein